MPNHFTTKISVRYFKWHDDSATNVEELYQKVYNYLTQAEGQALNCSELLPEPSELEGIHSGCCTAEDGTRLSYWRVIDGKNVPVDEEQLRARYGACSLYDWHINEWGSKWGTYNVEIYQADYDMYEFNIVIKYNSAWEPCYKLHGWLRMILDPLGIEVRSIGWDECEDEFDMSRIEGEPLPDSLANRRVDVIKPWVQRVQMYFGDEHPMVKEILLQQPVLSDI